MITRAIAKQLKNKPPIPPIAAIAACYPACPHAGKGSGVTMFEIPAWAGNGCNPPVDRFSCAGMLRLEQDPQKWTPVLRIMLERR
jgi:hypothetical protein